jgi:mersacidin/lichenicidin family type 2 lantibiotic
MSNNNIIRAWKDPQYRNSLSEAERAALPPHPAGAIEILDADLDNIAGGGVAAPVTHDCSNICTYVCTLGCTTPCTFFCRL